MAGEKLLAQRPSPGGMQTGAVNGCGEMLCFGKSLNIAGSEKEMGTRAN